MSLHFHLDVENATSPTRQQPDHQKHRRHRVEYTPTAIRSYPLQNAIRGPISSSGIHTDIGLMPSSWYGDATCKPFLLSTLGSRCLECRMLALRQKGESGMMNLGSNACRDMPQLAVARASWWSLFFFSLVRQRKSPHSNYSSINAYASGDSGTFRRKSSTSIPVPAFSLCNARAFAPLVRLRTTT